MEALSEIVRAGKVRYLGFSEWTPEQIRAGLEVAGAEKFVSSQPQYSMLWQAPEDEVFRLCAENGISQVVWSPLAEGVLTGKYKPGEAAAGRLARRERLDERLHHLAPDRRHARGRRPPGADRRGRGPDAWPSSRSPGCCAAPRSPRRSSAPRGPSRCEQNVAASGVTLSDDALRAIDEALGDVPVTGTTLAPGASDGRQAPLARWPIPRWWSVA